MSNIPIFKKIPFFPKSISNYPFLRNIHRNISPSFIHHSNLPDVTQITDLFMQVKKFFIIPSIITVSGYNFSASVYHTIKNFNRKNIFKLSRSILDLTKDISLFLLLLNISKSTKKIIEIIGSTMALLIYTWDFISNYKDCKTYLLDTIIAIDIKDALHSNIFAIQSISSLIKVACSIAGIVTSLFSFIGLIFGINLFAPNILLIVSYVHFILDWGIYFFSRKNE